MMINSLVVLMAGALLWYQGDGARPAARALADAVREIDAVDAMRSRLAASFSGEPDAQTFAQVCRPVGARLKRTAAERGWKIQQLALKYRNPAHQLDPQAEQVYRMMEGAPEILGLWLGAEVDGAPGQRYFRRIVVEPACLACHGPKEGRPQFVKDGYPEDRAYDFEPGDLRGLYSVFIPDAE